MPVSVAKPIAAGTPLSGTGTTTSASIRLSRPSCAPMRLRASYTGVPSITESGRAK